MLSHSTIIAGITSRHEPSNKSLSKNVSNRPILSNFIARGETNESCKAIDDPTNKMVAAAATPTIHNINNIAINIEDRCDEKYNLLATINFDIHFKTIFNITLC